MKKLIFILLSVITLSSCTNNVKITDEKTELPNKVVKSLDDTTLTKQYTIIETDDKLYLLTTKSNSKKFYVDKTIEKQAVDDGVWLLVVILGSFVFFLILGHLD